MIYEGEWRNDKKQGKGEITFRNTKNYGEEFSNTKDDNTSVLGRKALTSYKNIFH